MIRDYHRGEFHLPQYIVSQLPARVNGQIACFSSTHWQFLWQRPQQIMQRLSSYYNILYVDPPYPVSPVELAEREKQYPENLGARLKSIQNSLKILTPVKLAINADGMDNEDLARENARLVGAQIRKTLARLHWYQPLLWVYDLAAVPILTELTGRGVVYDCVDSFAAFSWADPHTSDWERKLLRRADVVITSARTLYQERREENPHIYLIPNAADFEHFAKTSVTTEPGELRKIPHPRLAFVGAVYEWLDMKLLAKLAQDHPAWSLVMIGPQQSGLELPEVSNLYWLGTREYKLLPWYMQYFEVMLIPFLHNEVTDHANPIKFWEYLAAGKPVVATRLPEIPPIPGVTWLCDNYHQFQEGCLKALKVAADPILRAETSEKARNFARINSWDERCRIIRGILRDHFNM